MLKVRNINKTYKGKIEFKALHNISFELPEKGLFAILGPSGCGKTTLLNIIGGMDSDFEGSIMIDNRVIDAKSKNKINDYRKDTIGFIFQHAVLLNSLTVYENIIFPLQIDSQPSQIQEKRATEILKLLNIYDLRRRKVNTLSGGQKQRVVIARALMNDPKIILADEPTGELDSKNSRIILDILQKLSSERLIIMVTHEEKFAYEYASKIFQMKDGQIINIINNEENVKESNLNINLTKKRKGNRKGKLPFLTNLKIAFRSLGLHKARNILSSIGLAIGLTGIALAITLTNGFQRFIVDALGGLKSENYIEVVKTNKNINKQISDADYDYVISNSGDVDLIKYQTYSPSYYQNNFGISLKTDKNYTITTLVDLLNYNYVSYEDERITPSLTKPLEDNEILVNSRQYLNVCDYYESSRITCSIQKASELLNDEPMMLIFEDNSSFLNNKTFRIVGFVETEGLSDYYEQSKIYHTNTDFATNFLKDSPYQIVRFRNTNKNALVLENNLTYTNNVNTKVVLHELNNNPNLSEYYFFTTEEETRNIKIQRAYRIPLNSTEINKIIKENSNELISYVNSKYFEIEENILKFSPNVFLSNDESLSDLYASRPDYYQIPIDELPTNLFNTKKGNIFTFRPLNEDGQTSIKYYNIKGSVPSKNDLNQVVISKKLADALLSGKPKNYDSLVNTKLYGNLTQSFNSIDFELTITGVALNEDTLSILSYSNWPNNFFNKIFLLESDDSIDVYSQVELVPIDNYSIFLFVKKNVNIANLMSKLKDLYPDYTFSNQIVEINNSINSAVEGVRTVLIVLSSISILVAVMLISMVSFISIIERRQEVGVMRTMGARKFDIGLLFINETVIIGVISSIIAYLFSMVIGFIINYIFQITLTLMTLGIIRTNFNIISFDLQALLVVFTTAIILSVIASILPAMKISNVDPIQALKKK